MSDPFPPLSLREEVEYYQNWQVKNAEQYEYQERILSVVFRKYHKHDCLCKVFLKVRLLDTFYSTQLSKHLPSVLCMAKHIFENIKDIDKSLAEEKDDAEGRAKLVDSIALCRNENTGKDFYFPSFATKYCSHHFPDEYPIYDSHVIRMLMHFKDRGFSSFTKKDIEGKESRCISEFYRVMEEFRTFKDFGLGFRYSFKKIDKYLWQMGKMHPSKKK